MKQNPREKTPEQMVEAIFALDLDPIKFKLMDKKEGHGWTAAEADSHELEYKRFLTLLAKFPEEVIAPDTDVDKFWHGHILDTMKYAVDCENVFGYFLHHFPYFGMRGEQDAANLASAAVNTQRLYEQEFGDAKAKDVSYCARNNVSYCARSNVSYCAAGSDKMVRKLEKTTAYCAATNVSYCAAGSDKMVRKLEQSIAHP